MKLAWALSLFLVLQARAEEQSLYNFKVNSIDNQSVDLSAYKGKTLLIVNTASKCGYTPQYKGLEELYNKYKAKGFVILGFPSNDFGGQEPGTNTEIKHFCQTHYSVDFPMFDKGPVKGAGKQPLFAYLISKAPAGHQGEIKWNFEKFLIGPTGVVVGRFDSRVTPESPELGAAIEKNLPPVSM